MKWYCLYTHPQKEGLVARQLGRMSGLECYYPKLKQRVTIRRVKREAIRPLFPRYLFCRFDASASYRLVRYSSEVVSVVNIGGEPIEVNECIIEGLKARATAAGVSDEILVEPELNPGTKMMIVSGCMRGLEGLFLRPMSGSERVAILLSTLNASVVVERSQCKVLNDTYASPRA